MRGGPDDANTHKRGLLLTIQTVIKEDAQSPRPGGASVSSKEPRASPHADCVPHIHAAHQVLGKLAPSEPAALSELIAIASGSAPGLGSNQPEAERRPLHRSVQQQLLTTLQVREAGLQPQQR
eukprot:362468-Chlamydomonas_euryale.AAC.1